ncbi:MAG TPA: hypothetical protein VFK06_23225 [Candidatus Angelobacter sp.]|nr:hypothetical protein [Candidatus Angelobacter sp.]
MGEAVVVAGSLIAQLTEKNTAASMAILANVFFMVFFSLGGVSGLATPMSLAKDAALPKKF